MDASFKLRIGQYTVTFATMKEATDKLDEVKNQKVGTVAAISGPDGSTFFRYEEAWADNATREKEWRRVT